MTTLQRLGDTLQRRQDVVRRGQWAMVGVYGALLLGPALLPVEGLARLQEAVFWGLWWPAVILATMLFGQVWCGLLCPDGTITEAVSGRGLALKVPAAMRWAGWPAVGFGVLTLWSALTGAHASVTGTLATVGGMSLAAILTGLLLGRGKRVWCRYLCPAGGAFSLLARCATLRFKVDRARWDAAPRPPKPVDCPLLLDVRRLVSNEKCNMCARCSGHRGAVALDARPPGEEIATLAVAEAQPRDAFTICFVLIGVAAAAQGPDGLLPKLLLAAGLGGAVVLFLVAAAKDAVRLAYGLIPLAGAGLFLGAADHGLALFDLVQAAHALRAAALTVGLLWSGHLGWRLHTSRAGYPIYCVLLGLLAVGQWQAPLTFEAPWRF